MVIQEKNKESLFNEEEKPKKFWVSHTFMVKIERRTSCTYSWLEIIWLGVSPLAVTSTRLMELLSWVAEKIEESSVSY